MIEHIFPLTQLLYDDYLWEWSQWDIFIISIFNKKREQIVCSTSPLRHKHNHRGSWTMNIWYLAENYDWLKGTRGLISLTHIHTLTHTHTYTHTHFLSHTHTFSLSHTHTLSLSLTHTHTHLLTHSLSLLLPRVEFMLVVCVSRGFIKASIVVSFRLFKRTQKYLDRKLFQKFVPPFFQKLFAKSVLPHAVYSCV